MRRVLRSFGTALNLAVFAFSLIGCADSSFSVAPAYRSSTLWSTQPATKDWTIKEIRYYLYADSSIKPGFDGAVKAIVKGTRPGETFRARGLSADGPGPRLRVCFDGVEEIYRIVRADPRVTTDAYWLVPERDTATTQPADPFTTAPRRPG